jgi:hypothetical protein
VSQAGQAQEILQTLLPEDAPYRTLSDLAVEVCGVVEQAEREIERLRALIDRILRLSDFTAPQQAILRYEAGLSDPAPETGVSQIKET